MNENLQIFSLVWFNNLSNENINSIQIQQQQLQTFIHSIKIFQEINSCKEYICSLTKFDRIILLINEQFARTILQYIHELRQLISIYIYYDNLQDDLTWTNEYKKIKSIKNNLSEIIIQMKIDHIKHKHLEEPLPIIFFDRHQSIYSLTSNNNIEFLSSQILIYFLSHIKLTEQDIQENKKQLINLCKNEYNQNSYQLKFIEEFENNYLSTNSCWWYTFNSFLYQLLIKSLITMNIELIYFLRFFIYDLYRQLKQYQTLNNKRFYRCYLMTNDELELFQQSIGKYLIINRFFTTYINRQYALDILSDNKIIFHRILFQFNLKSRLNLIQPFANLNLINQTNQIDEEILFSFDHIFQLENIYYQRKNNIYIIHLTLCNRNHHHFYSIFNYIKQQFKENDINLLTLANAFRRIEKLNQAEKCYQYLLKDSNTSEEFIARSYYYLGRIAAMKDEYETSLEYLYRSLEINLKLFQLNDFRLAQNYNFIGIIYQKQGENDKALEVFNKALIIWKEIYGKTHPNVAGCYNNMGVVYKRAMKYLQALECFEKALVIRERNSSTDPHDLAGSHNNIGAVYERLGHHELSIEHYNLSLKIKSKFLPAEHPSIASTLENLGYVYENCEAYIQALSYLEKAAIIYRKTSISSHHLKQIEQSLKRISSKL